MADLDESTRIAVIRYGCGDSIAAIAERLECSYGTARQLLLDAGVKLRTRQGRPIRKHAPEGVCRG